MLPASQIISRANQIAKAKGFTNQALDELNAILGDLCETYDFALARGTYSFNLDPSLSTNFGSGPYPLPLDYLRTSQSSGSEGVQYALFYTYNGVPYPLLPIDLGRWDMQVQQAGQQSMPYLFATDISPENNVNDRIVLATTGNTHTTTTLDGLATSTLANGMAAPSTAGLAVGMGVAGISIAPGTVISALTGSPPTSITLSIAATATVTGASVFFGIQPNAYVWPGPSGSFPTTLRYQKKMPPIWDTTRIPWFPNEGFLLDELAGRMMALTGDDRMQTFLGNAQKRLGAYLRQSDDKTNRAQTVILDRNRFGPRFSTLRNTKSIGW